jgi:hypothetical protein
MAMKRTLKLFALIVLAALSVAACGDSESADLPDLPSFDEMNAQFEADIADPSNIRLTAGGWEAFHDSMDGWYEDTPEGREILDSSARLHCGTKDLYTTIELAERHWNVARDMTGDTTSQEFSNWIRYMFDEAVAADAYICPHIEYADGHSSFSVMRDS